ncbi:MAG: SDR family oxidoreductase [Candidatus Dormiibacterota bacterium]
MSSEPEATTGAGRVAVLTGAAGGLGRAFAVGLAQAGIVVAGVDIADMAATADAVQAAGGTFLPLTIDLTSSTAAGELGRSVAAQFGRIDILVNNAGIYPLVAFEETTYQQWRQIMTLNLDGVFLATQSVLPWLKLSPSGRIVNIASAVIWLGPPKMVAYTTSKGGLIGFTRSLASELGPEGITVNAITPGLIPTETAVRTGVTAELERVVSGQAIPKVEKPEDLVSSLLFLCDERSGFVTGAAINADGGFAKH